MAEELQHLIDRIRKEGVETAEQEAEQVLGRARDKAAGIVRDAETRAREIVGKAKLDAEAFTEGSRRSLEQAARDLLITVGSGLESILNELVGEAVNETLDVPFLQDVLARIIESYAKSGGTETKIEVLAGPADQQKLIDFFRSRYHAKMGSGITVLADHEIVRGFKISSDGKRLQHEFTGEAIADALSTFLRPHLNEIVHRVACPDANGGEG